MFFPSPYKLNQHSLFNIGGSEKKNLSTVEVSFRTSHGLIDLQMFTYSIPECIQGVELPLISIIYPLDGSPQIFDWV